MPANPKYLEKSNWQKFAKISAGIIGGCTISILIHLILPILFQPYHKELLLTAIYTMYILWTLLIFVPFFFKNGWIAWLLYLVLIVILYVVYQFAKPHNPFV